MPSELLFFHMVFRKLPLKLVYKSDWRVAIVKSGIKVVAISQMFNIYQNISATEIIFKCLFKFAQNTYSAFCFTDKQVMVLKLPHSS